MVMKNIFIHGDSGQAEQAAAQDEIIDIEDIVDPFIPSSQPDVHPGTPSSSDSGLPKRVPIQSNKRGRKPKETDGTEDPKLDKRRKQKRESARNCRGKVQQHFQVLKQKYISLKSERDQKRKQVYKLQAMKSYFKSYLVTFKSMLGVAAFASPTIATLPISSKDYKAQTKNASLVVSTQQNKFIPSLSESNLQAVVSGSKRVSRSDSGNRYLPASNYAGTLSQGAGHVTTGSGLSAVPQPYGLHDMTWQDMSDTSNLTSAASLWADMPTSFTQSDTEFTREMLTATDLTALMSAPERGGMWEQGRWDLDKDLLRLLAPVADYPVQDFVEDELYGRKTVGSPASGVADLEELSALLASDTPFT